MQLTTNSRHSLWLATNAGPEIQRLALAQFWSFSFPDEFRFATPLLCQSKDCDFLQFGISLSFVVAARLRSHFGRKCISSIDCPVTPHSTQVSMFSSKILDLAATMPIYDTSAVIDTLIVDFNI